MSQLWPILLLSLQVSGFSVLISSLLGIPIGVWLGLSEIRWKQAVLATVYTGMALPPVVVGLLVYLLLSRSGPLGFLGWLFTPIGMILAQILLALPFVIGITRISVASVPSELHWQFRTLGLSSTQASWQIMREARPGIILAVATAFGRSWSEVGAVWLIGGNIEGKTRVLTTAIVLETGKGNFILALTLGAVLLGLALIVNVAILHYKDRLLP